MVIICSPELTAEFVSHEVPKFELILVDLFVGQTTVHVAVVNSEAQTLTLRLWMNKLINKFNCFS